MPTFQAFASFLSVSCSADHVCSAQTQKAAAVNKGLCNK